MPLGDRYSASRHIACDDDVSRLVTFSRCSYELLPPGSRHEAVAHSGAPCRLWRSGR
jgi:hypothetical protein